MSGLNISFDDHTHAVSLILSDEPVARTVETGRGHLVDLDENGRVLAVEMPDIREAEPLTKLDGDFDLTELVSELVAMRERLLEEEHEKQRRRSRGQKQKNARIREVLHCV